MPREIKPKDTTRASAYELWMKAPNPMVTFFKTLDVTNLIKISKRNIPCKWLKPARTGIYRVIVW